MILQAHMGVSKRFPENTMSAFKAAAREGYKIIELDMKFTRDNKCVIIHDFTLERTARNLDGTPLEKDIEISALNYSELSKYDFGVHFSEAFKGEKIPTLEEVLNFARESRIKLKFDNVLQQFDDKLIDLFFDEIEANYTDGVIGFTSNDLAFVKRIVSRFSTCDIHYDGAVNEDTLEALKKIAPDNSLYIWMPIRKMAWLDFPPADKKQIQLARKYGLAGIWYATEESELERCLELMPDVVETDGTITVNMIS